MYFVPISPNRIITTKSYTVGSVTMHISIINRISCLVVGKLREKFIVRYFMILCTLRV